MAILLSIAGFIVLNTGLIPYFMKLKKNETPKNPVLLKVAMAIGSLLAIIALFTTFSAPALSTILVILLAFITLSTSATFAYFLANKATPVGDIKVKVGDEILPFKSNGFDSESLKGQRTLLKFYRGTWCPYCSAELVMFEELKPKLNEYGVQIVAISNDTEAEQQQHKQRDNISHTLVSDPELNVIRQYGVEHQKTLGGSGDDLINMFGIAMPMPWKMKRQSMSIPTSMLIDEAGKIVWIDQSDDYRLRASEALVMGAVTANFDKQ